jgi:NADPH-dependent glutamate synthase beta subunit-like oxidoreductase
VAIHLDTPVGRAVTLEQLQTDFDAVLIAAGAHAPIRLNIPGESLTGVLHGVTFMRKVNLKEETALGRRVAVIGGGNTAIDCARSARYLGAEEVTVFYRRTREEMPVSAEEVVEAEEEGVRIEFLVSPVRVIGDSDGRVTGLACVRNRLSTSDAGGRPRPVPIEGSAFVRPVDTVLPAVSQSPDTSFLPDVFSRSGLERVEVDPITFMTNVPGVFAVGDYTTGPRDVISVIADAHRVAASIRRYLEGPTETGERDLAFKPARLPHAPGSDYEALPRQKMPTLPPADRQSMEQEIQLGFTPETAMREARRCLRCDHNILIDGRRCILCAGCLDACPQGCIQMIPTDRIAMDASVPDPAPVEPGTALVLDEAHCIRCGLCVKQCPTGAIRMERVGFKTGNGHALKGLDATHA